MEKENSVVMAATLGLKTLKAWMTTGRLSPAKAEDKELKAWMRVSCLAASIWVHQRQVSDW
jgi:hypothetical protein